jgi:hypothetical protein
MTENYIATQYYNDEVNFCSDGGPYWNIKILFQTGYNPGEKYFKIVEEMFDRVYARIPSGRGQYACWSKV